MVSIFSDLDSRFRLIGISSLQIAKVKDSDSGNYQCRAGNIEDSVDIQTTLQVQEPPKFMEKPIDQVALEKDEIEFKCNIRGKPTPIIEWLKNGDKITPNDYMQIVNGHNLRILGLLSTDAGMFQCIGRNTAGSVQASARLTVKDQGKIHLQSTYVVVPYVCYLFSFLLLFCLIFIWFLFRYYL